MDKALEAFLAKKSAIDTLLEELAGASEGHFDWPPGEINWGHVGSLEYVEQRLREAMDHLRR